MGYGQGRAVGAPKAIARTVVLASADAAFRQRLRRHLIAMRWQVREAGGGAEAMAQLDTSAAEALLVADPLPDLEVSEFLAQMRSRYPDMDLLRINGGVHEAGARSPRRNELLHALRLAQDEEDGGTRARSDESPHDRVRPAISSPARIHAGTEPGASAHRSEHRSLAGDRELVSMELATRTRTMVLPEMVGEGTGMRELARLVRLVAPRSTAVLIEGATGTGKELVARAVHRLSARTSRPFVVLNCAAIPESLLEAELFGHTRGAFTGAVQSRTGRIEAAHGGTLFLDEIGEMPIALQAKMLRFLESGELQRVGDNDTVTVDVRVIAATHQPLQQRAAERTFRLDLYHRLAVFPVRVPALSDRKEDVLPLAGYLLERLGEEMPVKRLSAAAAQRLMEHDWPGNVRELSNVLERAAILAEDRPEIAPSEIQF